MTSILNGEMPGMNSSPNIPMQADANAKLLCFEESLVLCDSGYSGGSIQAAQALQDMSTPKASEPEQSQGAAAEIPVVRVVPVVESTLSAMAMLVGTEPSVSLNNYPDYPNPVNSIKEEENKVEEDLLNNNYINGISSEDSVGSQSAHLPQERTGRVSVITSETPKVLGKRFWFDREVKRETSAQITQGVVDVREFSTVKDFIALLRGISVSQALCSSVPRNAKAHNVLVTKAALPANPQAIARTKDDFVFASDCGGILTLDYDPPSSNALSREALLAALVQVCPDIVNAGVVWWCSSSSYIFVGEQSYQDLQGQRLYILVQDASDIQRAGKMLASRLWLLGHGRIQISASGQRLERTLVDCAMFEPARLDFIGGAVCEPPLRQDRGEPISLCGHGWLNTAVAIPDLNEEEFKRYEVLLAQMKEEVNAEAQAARKKWKDDRQSEYVQRLTSSGVDSDQALRMADDCLVSALDRKLDERFRIALPDGKFVLVGEILDSPAQWDGKLTLDPLEPEYGGGRVVGIIYADGSKARLHSQAHGGATYELIKGKKLIVLKAGEVASTIETIAQHLSGLGEFYAHSESLVQLRSGRLVPLTEFSLKMVLAQKFDVKKYDSKSKLIGADIPADVPKMILASVSSLPFQPLIARVGLPCVTPQGREITRNGYDPSTQMYFDLPADFCAPVYANADQRISAPEIAQALKTLWKPFSLYMFDSPVSRAAMLSALLTAVNRPVLQLAPGFAIDAAGQSVGKSMIAQSLNVLKTGNVVEGASAAPSGQRFDDELAKTLLSKAMAGSSVYTCDNIVGTFESPYLSRLMTELSLNVRRVHTNVEYAALQRFFFTATGNNLQMHKDLINRFQFIRILPTAANPAFATFPFSPLEEVQRTRTRMAEASLTVLQAFVQAGMPQIAQNTSRFAEWNRLVRNCILWLTQAGHATASGIGALGDPADAFLLEHAADQDLETAALASLLRGLRKRFGSEFFKSSDLKDLCNAIHPSNDPGAEEIRDAIITLCPTHKTITSIVIGRKLASLREIHCDGHKLIYPDKKNGDDVRLFAVVPVN